MLTINDIKITILYLKEKNTNFISKGIIYFINSSFKFYISNILSNIIFSNNLIIIFYDLL